MRRKIYLMSAVAILAVLVMPQGASAGKPATVCPPGFDIGEVTLEEAIALPNTQRGLEDGFFTLEGTEAGFDALDRNDDGLVCFRSFPAIASSSSLLQYFYNGVDNNPSVPGG